MRDVGPDLARFGLHRVADPLGVVEHPVAQLAEPVVAALDPDRLPLGLVGADPGDGLGDEPRGSRPRPSRSGRRSRGSGRRASPPPRPLRRRRCASVAFAAVPLSTGCSLSSTLGWSANCTRPSDRNGKRSARDEAVDRPFQRGDVEVVGVVFAEGGRAFDREPELALAAGPLQVGDEAAQLALAEVGVDVALIESAQAAVADDVAADDRAAAAAAVGVGEDRFGRTAGVRGVTVFFGVGSEALERVPAEVGAARGRDGRVVELLELVLADVADRDPRLRGADRVEGEAEGVAQAVAVDLVAAALADERVASSGPSRAGRRTRPRIDPQQLAEQAPPCSGRCSAGRRRSRRRRCRSRGGRRGTASGRRCGWR